MSAHRTTVLALLLAPAAALGYVQTTTASSSPPCPGPAVPLEWFHLPVGYQADSAGSDDITGTSAQEAVDASFATWSAPTCTAVDFVAAAPGPTTVGFQLGGPNVNAVKWIETGWTQSARAIAVTLTTFSCTTGEILDADITLNGASFTFTTEPSTTAADVQNTVTHEAGHLLGFDHSPDPDSTMYADAPLGETTKRSLTDDDITGLCTVYPTDFQPPSTGGTPTSKHHGGCSGGPAGAPALALVLALVGRRLARRRPASYPYGRTGEIWERSFSASMAGRRHWPRSHT